MAKHGLEGVAASYETQSVSDRVPGLPATYGQLSHIKALWLQAGAENGEEVATTGGSAPDPFYPEAFVLPSRLPRLLLTPSLKFSLLASHPSYFLSGCIISVHPPTIVSSFIPLHIYQSALELSSIHLLVSRSTTSRVNRIILPALCPRIKNFDGSPSFQVDPRPFYQLRSSQYHHNIRGILYRALLLSLSTVATSTSKQFLCTKFL